jgi:hypothetical protein
MTQRDWGGCLITMIIFLFGFLFGFGMRGVLL